MTGLRALPTPVTARAHGKINLHLGVGDAGADGYHELVTVFEALGTPETVTLTPADEDSVEVVGKYAAAGIPVDERNLALAAVIAFRARTGWDGRVAITIDKNVPVAGGMGGGSADAAAALVAAASLAGVDDNAVLTEIAAGLGADVPFALLGGIALGRGRGDDLSRVLSRGTHHWVLATSTGELSTASVYGRMDELRQAGDGADAVRLAEPQGVLTALAAW